MASIKNTENPFPEDLEGRLNAVANIVNNELKLITLLHLDDTLVEGNDILTRVRKSVGRDVRLTIGRNFSHYCHRSLLPIGAAAEEEIRRNDGEVISVGYRITAAGRKYGVPISVFSLQYGVDNDLSLYSVLGPTSSRGKTRSPLNRIRILKELRKGIFREVDLSETTGTSIQGVGEHLESLEKMEFVKYDSVQELHECKGMFQYRYTGKPGEPESIKGRKTLTQKVFELICQLKIAERNTIADKVGRNNLRNISGILVGLEKQGFLERVGYFKGREIYSRAEITERGRKFVDEYIGIVEAALTDDSFLNFLKENSERFLHDPETTRKYLINGIKNYWKVSPRGNAKPREETNLRIIDYIQVTPGARPRDIKKDLGLDVTNYLTPLVKTGILEKRQLDKDNKSAVGYFVKK